MNKLITVLISLSVILSSTGCEIIPTKTVFIEPPSNLLIDTEYQSFKELELSTPADLIETYTPYLKSKIEECNVDKKGVRDFIQEIKEKAP